MDRNREARRAAAMANGVQRRRHRTTSTPGSLRDSPDDDGGLELQETARFRDRTVKKERDRERDRDRDRDRERDRERERLSRSKRRRGDKYMNREDGVDDSSEESVNDEEEEEEDGMVRYVPPSNPVPISTSSAASTLTSHRKSYPPPSKVYRVAPTWKAPDEMIGFSVPRKARSASTKRSHDCWTGGGVVGGEQIQRQPSPSQVTSTATATPTVPSKSPSPARPMSPSTSNISIKKKIKTNGAKQRPPKSSSLKSSPSIQDEIEIEVAEVLYGLMRQSQAPSPKQDTVSNDLAPKSESRSIGDSKPSISSPICNSSAPLTTVAPKRKRPRPYPEDIPGGPDSRSSPISSVPKTEPDQPPKQEAPSVSADKNEVPMTENESGLAMRDTANNCIVSDNDNKKTVEESSGGRKEIVVGRASAKVGEASSSSPKSESLNHQHRHHDRVVESSSTPTKPNSSDMPKENCREEKVGIDLMAPPLPEKVEEIEEYKGGDEECMVTDKKTEVKLKTNEEGDEKKTVELNRAAEETAKESSKSGTAVSLSSTEPPHQQLINLNGNIDLHLDLEKATSVNDCNLNSQPPHKPGGQSSSVPLPMQVPAGWHGGLAPLGYVGPLQGVVSMDGTTMASPPIQPTPHFLFSQPPKRCATHCYIAKSIENHQKMMVKMNSFWPAAAAAAAAASTAPLFGGKPYNLNMVPPADLHAAGRAGVASSATDNKGQPFAFFPGQPPSSSKDSKSSQAANVPDSAQKKQFVLQPALPPGAASNIMHAPALFFPMGQQQAAASVRPSVGKSQSSGSAASTSMQSSTSTGAATSSAPQGPAMSFSYPGMGGNETQFMAILGNGAYPFPIPAHVGAAPPYRGSHPQAMSFYNGSFYPSQMLHPSQLQPQQPGPPSQSFQMQQQNHQNASHSSASPFSQKHLQNQHQRPQGSGANASGNVNQNPSLQNFQVTKARETGGDDSPSTADSRNRHNLSMYSQNFAMPFHSPNFALMPSSLGGASSNAGAPNGNHGDRKQQQQFQPALNAPPFPMSFTTINGGTTSTLDMSTMAQNHAMLQSLPESARQSYQMMAAAAAAQAAQQKKNSYRGPEDGKSGGSAATDNSNVDEERKVMSARPSSASVGQSITFSRDLAENTVVDSSARSLNLVPGSGRSARPSPGPNAVTSSSATNSQQQQSQKLLAKQQQHAASTATNAVSKMSSTGNGSFYSDQMTSSSILTSKFPSTLSGFPSLMQTSSALTQPLQWKNSVRPNTSQMSSPSIGPTSCASNMKNISSQQQGRPQQNHTQISFGAAVANSKPSSASHGQQTQTSSQAPSSPMMIGSPSNSSLSKSAGGSPRTTASASAGNKSQASALSSQQGRNSPSPSLTSQKPSILGSPHLMSSSGSAGKPQSQQSQQQPQLSKQTIQQAQLYFSNGFMQASANTSAAMGGAGYYLQRHKPDNQHQQQGSKSQGSGPSMSSGMLSLSTPVSLVNATTDPAKAAAVASNVKGGLPSQGVFGAAQFAQSAWGAHQLMNPNFPYVHAMSSATVQAKPAEQKRPAGE